VDDAAVDRTIDILRRQRTRFAPASRPARDADRLTVDFEGTIAGQAFDGGKAENFVSRSAKAACCRSSSRRARHVAGRSEDLPAQVSRQLPR